MEDLELGTASSVEQERGLMTPFNASHLPFDANSSTEQAILDRYTKVEAATHFAKIGGDSTVAFKCFAGINPTETINVEQLDNLMLNTIALQANVLELDNSDVYNPATNYNPATKLYVDIAISDRFTGVVSGNFTSADGKTITVTGGLVTSIV